MNENDWKNNPLLQSIAPEKLELLTELAEESKTKPSKEILPYFLALNAKAAKQGVTFTDAETELILGVLKERMTPEDLKKIETIRKLSRMLDSRQKKG